MEGVVEEIRKLLSQGMSSRQIIDLEFAPRTVYKVQHDFRRKNTLGNEMRMRADSPDRLAALARLLSPEHSDNSNDDFGRKAEILQVLRVELDRIQREKEKLQFQDSLIIWEMLEVLDKILGEVDTSKHSS